ncbi:MAG: hypothetical protein V3V29_03545 [Acidimicrobiia bacterium]
MTAGPVVTAEGVDDAWATQQLTIVSEWRTPMAIAPSPHRHVLDSRRVSDPGTGAPADVRPTVIQSGGSIGLQLVLAPRLSTGPAPGIYVISVPISYWRDVDPATGPTGAAEGTLALLVTYEILDAREASAVLAFCDAAVDAAVGLADPDMQWLTDGLEEIEAALKEIEAAATRLPSPRGDDLLAETSALRLNLEKWFGPEPGHGGFSTGGVIGIINRLCATHLLELSVQP